MWIARRDRGIFQQRTWAGLGIADRLDSKTLCAGGVYINFLSARDGEDWMRAAYRETKFERLVQLKNKYDPQNLMQVNRNIKPV